MTGVASRDGLMARLLVAGRRSMNAALSIYWPPRLAYLMWKSRAATDRDALYRRLSFEELRRLSEFAGGRLAEDVSRFLRADSRHNAAFQEWWFAAAAPEGRFDRTLGFYRRLEALLDRAPVRSLIDLGCNAGEVVQAAAARGIDALGVDLPAVVERITLPIRTVALDLNREFPTGTYDVIVCREVFEHVSDADAFLERCAGIARPGSMLLLSCPYTARHFSGNAFHLRVLSRKALVDLVERHGFAVHETFEEHESNVVVAEHRR